MAGTQLYYFHELILCQLFSSILPQNVFLVKYLEILVILMTNISYII